MLYTLTRSKRKTCAIYVRDGAVEVRAPLGMPKPEIDRFVASKERWITEKLAASASRMERRAAFLLDYGGTVRYRGGDCPLVARPGSRVGLSAEGFYLPPGLPPEGIKQACIRIYRLCAKAVLTERVSVFAEVVGASPAAVRINGAQSRWGSCSGKKNLNFSWRLMMAADPVIDYVVVHELAHLKEMNHSAGFWKIVERVLPDYKERQKQLRELQIQLRAEDWT